MIRFGTGKSAELYLTLGDLLAIRGDKHLAYRALPACIGTRPPRKAYLQEVLKELPHFHEDESEFAPEVLPPSRASADAWVLAYQTFEDDLIRAGKDPDDEANLVPFYAATAKPNIVPPKTLADRMPTRPRSGRHCCRECDWRYSYSRCGNPALEIHST